MNGQNKYNKSSKPRFIFEEHNEFIKREPSIDEELHAYPIIKAVKTEQNEAIQYKNNDSQFPIESNAVDIQAKVLQTFAPAMAKVTKHYTIATNDNDGNSLVPNLIENGFPIETKTVKVENENFEPITQNIDIDMINNEYETKPCYVLLTRDDNLRCNYCDFKTKDIPKLLRHTNKCSHRLSIPIETVNKVRDVKKGYVPYNHWEHQTKEKSQLINERQMPSTSVRKKRPLRKLKHECCFCDAKFTTKLKMQEHIKEHTMRRIGFQNKRSRCILRPLQMSIPKQNLLACNLCSRKCCSMTGLKNHARKVHRKEMIEFICDTCGLSFQWKSQIMKHLKEGICELGQTTEFTDNDADNFDFDMYRVKNTEKKYSIHQMRVREPGYRCIECSFKCTQPISLREHRKLHCMNNKRQHKKTAIKYSCQFCKFKSLSEDSLNEHMMKDHKDEKPYFCKLCDCKYSRVNDLVKHIKSHLNRR